MSLRHAINLTAQVDLVNNWVIGKQKATAARNDYSQASSSDFGILVVFNGCLPIY